MNRNIVTVNPKQEELANAYLDKYAAVHGEDKVGRIAIEGKKNHRVTINKVEFSYSALEEAIKKLGEESDEEVTMDVQEEAEQIDARGGEETGPDSTKPDEPDDVKDDEDERYLDPNDSEITEEGEVVSKEEALKRLREQNTRRQAEESRQRLMDSIKPKLDETMREYAEARTLEQKGPLVEGEKLWTMRQLTMNLDSRAAAKLTQEAYDRQFGLDVEGNSRFPKKASEISKRISTYENWVVNAGVGIDEARTHPDYKEATGDDGLTEDSATGERREPKERPMRLATVGNYQKLVALNRVVVAENSNKLLAFAHRYPYNLIVDVARHLTDDNYEQVIDNFKEMTIKQIQDWVKESDGEPTEPTHATVKTERGAYDTFMEAMPGIADAVQLAAPHKAGGEEAVEGYGISRTVGLEVAAGVTKLLPPFFLGMYVKQLYGTLTESEYELLELVNRILGREATDEDWEVWKGLGS